MGDDPPSSSSCSSPSRYPGSLPSSRPSYTDDRAGSSTIATASASSSASGTPRRRGGGDTTPTTATTTTTTTTAGTTLNSPGLASAFRSSSTASSSSASPRTPGARAPLAQSYSSSFNTSSSSQGADRASPVTESTTRRRTASTSYSPGTTGRRGTRGDYATTSTSTVHHTPSPSRSSANPGSADTSPNERYDFPSLVTTSPPMGLHKASPVVSGTSSPRSSPRVRPTSKMSPSASMTAAQETRSRASLGSGFAVRRGPSPPPSVTSSPSGSSTSVRRKPPPLTIESGSPRSLRTKAQVMTRADSSDSSDMEPSTSASAARGSTTRRTREDSIGIDDYANWSMPPATGTRDSVISTPVRPQPSTSTGAARPPPPSESHSFASPGTRAEERDTLSGLGYHGDNRAEASTSGLALPSASSLFAGSASTAGSDPGLGLSSSFSTSRLGADSSTGHSTSYTSTSFEATPSSSTLSRRRDSSSSTLALDASRSSSSISGPESPVTDRRQLIGLGELATPRWTSGASERRWGSMDDDQTMRDMEYLSSSVPREPMLSLHSPVADRQPLASPQPSAPASARSSSFPAQPMHPTTLFPSTAGGSNSGSGTPVDTRAIDDARLSKALADVSLRGTISSSPRVRSTPTTPSITRQEAAGTVRSNDSEVPASSTSTSGVSWPRSEPFVGLGLDYESGGTPGRGAGEVDEQDTLRRRTSSSGRRTSSIGAKTSSSSAEGKSPSLSSTPRSNTAHRRSLTGKSGAFSHLPPSPAASTAAHALAASTTSTSAPPPPAPPFASTSTTTASSGSTTSSHQTAPQTTPGRPTDRLSHQSLSSHHASPSMVAASILRQTQKADLGRFDMHEAAAADEGTAEALRKLDGLCSPRVSRVLPAKDIGKGVPSGSSSSGQRSRQNSLSRRNSEELRIKRRTRNSVAGVLAKEAENEPLPGVDAERLSTHPSSEAGTTPTPAVPSPSSLAPTPSMAALEAPRSPLVASSGAPEVSSARTGSSASPAAVATHAWPSPATLRTPSHVSTHYDVPFPSSSPVNRGSSSSTTGGTFTSHESTSAASLSSYSLATTAPRSSSSKNRRSSMSSDVSSVPSVTGEGGDARESAGENDTMRYIPPVPPLPKDFELYHRSPNTFTTTSSAQNSPRAEAPPAPAPNSTRPSESTHLLSPGPGHFEFPTSARTSTGMSPTSPKMHPPPQPRKWSLSNAFSKATMKGSKTSGVKESNSFTDLAATSIRSRKTSTTSRIFESGLPRRMASSSNDIVGLAASTSGPNLAQPPPAPSQGSFGRSSRHLAAIVTSRQRTVSQSSSSIQSSVSVANPSVIATSPGRSRSSLLSPRRTPSGIPFFSKSSDQAPISATTPSPNSEQSPRTSTPPSSKSAGRKSILGFHFLRKDKDRDAKKDSKSPASSPLSNATSRRGSTASSVFASAFDEPRVTDEFGRRTSIASTFAKSTSTGPRKRGNKQTLSIVNNSKPAERASRTQAQLPPLHVPALSATTARRIDSLSSVSSTSSASKTGSLARVPVPTNRISKLQDSVKANLPPIVGSPSSHAVPSVSRTSSSSQRYQQHEQCSRSPSRSPVPKSQTPTKIPRFGTRPSTASTDRATPRGPISRDTSPVVDMGHSGSHSVSRHGYLSKTVTPDLSHSTASDARAPSIGASEFGAATKREPGLTAGVKTLSTRRRLDSESHIPRSRSTALAASTNTVRTAREDPITASQASTSIHSAPAPVPRATRRHSIISVDDGKIAATPARVHPRTTSLYSSTTKSSGSLDPSTLNSSTSSRKTLPRTSELATGSVNKRSAHGSLASSTASVAESSTPASASTLSSSRSSRTLATKLALPSRISRSSTSPSLYAEHSNDSGRSSATSSQSTVVTEDEVRGDEEMSAYVRRQQAKRLAAGMTNDAIRKMFEFPEPTQPLPPLSHRDALSLYSRYLSQYERQEIREYENVYFVGPNCDKKPATLENTTNNHGYDDERGDYLLVNNDHIRYRYEVIDVLGKGSFGQVLQCRDHKTGEMVAIKIIRNKKRFHHQALVEIKVLENLVEWDPEEKHFVIRMVDSFTFRGHLCIVTELLSINLYELVKANSFNGFSTILIRRFTIQILGSLSLLRHHRVVHCDLKPENILLKHPARSGIKVIDFGSSCFENEKVYTYIQSRFYRSPEVILGMNYHMAIDMWSLGCIIAEMYTGYPIFPGENEQEQLACIMEVMGLPDKYLIDRSSRKRLFFDSTGAPRPVVNSKGRRRRPGTKTLAQVLKTDDELFLDFITKCLTWDPDRRLKPDPALRHPWIVAARTRATSPTAPPRTSRSSTATGSSMLSGPSSTSTTTSLISTPRKKVGTIASSSNTAPVQRTRTHSSVTVSNTIGVTGASGAPRLSSKGSLQLPPSRGYSTVRASVA
ncbi:BZ3500_MvSof-1268-A1-R1_Chr3-1g05997 [Microbotryum saponariae]|uniref:dual-specificity kinase n=1 Tax=Microbotryum saponariae TaxID=289078 RepID=A0A2X0NIS3_9BASI|nr:BZ3500_MvSof-1268-A1-R1_Chr3-1g05997 [Microbotryum saponariae]SDA05187.1 BZ3501_MvSof-1269-A2-R1_Chr3-1g05667 [Microbotryum saponariae]